MRRFEDKVVLLTGAASGIGRATAGRLAAEGARLLCLDVQPDALKEAVEAAAAGGARVEARVCDVSREEETEAAVADCVERFGRLDVLCNVAGVLRFEHLHAQSLEAWRQVMAVNLDGTFLLCRAALPHLLASRGNVVNVSSIAALSGLPYGAAYGASKAGVLALTRSLAVEYAARGLRANAVCPGSVKTPMTRSPFPKDVDTKLVMRQMALSGFAEPEAVAGVIAFVASDDASHVNGETLRVDGGTLA